MGTGGLKAAGEVPLVDITLGEVRENSGAVYDQDARF